MPEATTVPNASDRLAELVRRLEAVEGFAAVVASLSAGQGATLDGVWGSSCALAAAALLQHARGPLVVVCPHPGDLDDFLDDLALFAPVQGRRFPSWETLPSDRLVQDEVFGDRLRLLKQLAAGEKPPLIVTSVQALLQPVPDRQRLRSHSRTLGRGETVDPQELLRWLADNGFQGMSGVEMPGEFAVHGGIVDIFAPDWDNPLRVEFFGEEVESLRWFDVATQRSLAVVDAVDLTLLGPHPEDREHFSSYLPADAWVMLIEPAELEEEGRHYLQRVERADDFHQVSDALQRMYRFASVTGEAVSAGSFDTSCHLKVESVERFSGDVAKVRQELESAAADQEVFVVCQTSAEVRRLEEIFAETPLLAQGRLHFPLGRLHAGFRLAPAQTMLLGSTELFNRPDPSRPSRRRFGRIIDSFLDLREGDYVVHVSHGIGRYLGLKLLDKPGQLEEHLELEFHGGTKIYVPTSKIQLVQKYVGGTKSRPTLARIGGKLWTRHKQQAEQAVIDLAADMLDLQARRASQPGITFGADTEWQHEFDSSFPYDETADQLSAIDAIKRDMLLDRPMDRLICGDVGYGKTEVAMRAVFKAIDAGYQVAVLVPTTVLAEQHRRTFTARMAEYPFRIAALSRFLTRREQDQVLVDLAAGKVDIVIGTHRLVQHDVRFANLGLVVIDEEQRFGVEVKERLKTLRQIVDVLTLTATPIPRTLHMSLLGLRDISNLETPPEDRLAVETRVTRFSQDMIRQAILRELNRNGQVFFVHNRIHDIEALQRRLNQIVPEASIRIGHGQMAEGELEEVMLDFVEHRFDVLLATTIVESGLDIPNANTIFIDQADTYGLADLHQLRGRVGRYKHRAYCYLLVDPHKALSPNSAKRLRAIEEYSHIGAGFAIAMRDLEIRGAGNILGTQQSGHIATVGYELYCQLLEDAVRKMKHLPPAVSIDVHVDLPGEAFIPRSYVPDMRHKIDLYRRLGRLTTDAELDDLAAEMVDRFGPRPAVVDRLISLMRLRVWAFHWQIHSIHIEDDYFVFGYHNRLKIEQLARSRSGPLRVVDDDQAYLPAPQAVSDADLAHERLKSLLRPG